MNSSSRYRHKVARESFDFNPAQVRLKTVEGQRDPVITSITGALMREVMNGDAGSRLYAESLANMLAVHLLRNYTEHAEPIETEKVSVAPRSVIQAMKYIPENYSGDVSLAKLVQSPPRPNPYLWHQETGDVFSA